MHVDDIRRLAVIGELRRIGQLIQGDPHAYDDLILELEDVWSLADEASHDPGSPLPEESFDA